MTTAKVPPNKSSESTTIFAHTAGPFVSMDGRCIDPLNDAALDALLEEMVPAVSEPRLIVIDRLLNKLRFRREV